MEAAPVLTPPRGDVAVPCQVAVGPPGAGPTVPDEGFCARIVLSGTAVRSAIPLIKNSLLTVWRALNELGFVFIIMPSESSNSQLKKESLSEPGGFGFGMSPTIKD